MGEDVIVQGASNDSLVPVSYPQNNVAPVQVLVLGKSVDSVEVSDQKVHSNHFHEDDVV